MSARSGGERILPPKSHVTRHIAMKTVLLLSDMDIDGDGLLGLVENGGNALAAEIIPNVAHRLKVIRKINYLARHQGDGNIASK